MKSIYEDKIGTGFTKLHPLLQKKYGLTSQSDVMAVGTGKMIAIRGGKRWMFPCLALSANEHLLFPERGDHIPFRIENMGFQNEEGIECVSFIRRFYFPKKIRAFDAIVKAGREKQTILDEFGLHQMVSSSLSLEVTTEGGLLIQSKSTHIEGYMLPSPFHLSAEIYEKYDEKQKAIRIHVHLYHSLIKTVLMYEGLVDITFVPITKGAMNRVSRLETVTR